MFWLMWVGGIDLVVLIVGWGYVIYDICYNEVSVEKNLHSLLFVFYQVSGSTIID